MVRLDNVQSVVGCLGHQLLAPLYYGGEELDGAFDDGFDFVEPFGGFAHFGDTGTDLGGELFECLGFRCEVFDHFFAGGFDEITFAVA